MLVLAKFTKWLSEKSAHERDIYFFELHLSRFHMAPNDRVETNSFVSFGHFPSKGANES
jgi:hypothetical protein